MKECAVGKVCADTVNAPAFTVILGMLSAEDGAGVTVFPVVNPLTVDQPEGVVEAAIVVSPSMSDPTLPLKVRVVIPGWKVMVSEKVIVPSFPLASVAEPSAVERTAPILST